jgi:ABC-type glycerol-3-phosphate transport system permease component
MSGLRSINIQEHTPRGIRFLAQGALVAYVFWVAAPFFWVVVSSLKSDSEILHKPLGLPDWSGVTGAAYCRAWTEGGIGSCLLNSALIAIVSVVLILWFGSMAAYVLARYRHPWGRVVRLLFLAGLMLPAQLAMVPLFFELRALGLLETRAGLVLVYVANGLPFAIFILTAFFRDLPRSLQEAAVIDGCSESGVFWRVMLPLARPGLITVAIFQFIGLWKEYFFAFMLVGGGNGSARTLPLALADLAISAQYRSDQGMLFAGLVIVTLPMLAAYVLMQGHLVRGIAAGAVKG